MLYAILKETNIFFRMQGINMSDSYEVRYHQVMYLYYKHPSTFSGTHWIQMSIKYAIRLYQSANNPRTLHISPLRRTL